MSERTENFTLNQWLSWIEQGHPTEIELGLERVTQVADRMDIRTPDAKVITIAGTNGKGSTVTYLETILLKAGYTVGCYTSPHFRKYNERVRLNGKNISDEHLCHAFQSITDARAEISLTYFEYGTLAALEIFKRTQPDVILLEVGLGGRLDAVNIVDADVSAVTSIAIDHVDWLGDDREVIGREKSGIFRAGRPAVCGEADPTASVAEVAASVGAQLYQVGEAFSYQTSGTEWNWQGVCPVGETLKLDGLPTPTLPLPNAATALQVLAVSGLNVSPDAIRQGLAEATMTGRMQRVALAEGDAWLDVAHNPEAAELLAGRLASMAQPGHMVLGMLGDKDFASVIEILRPEVSYWYLADLNVPRGQKAEALAEHLSDEKGQGRCATFSNVADALSAARQHLNKDITLLVAGSFFTVSDALDYLGVEE